MDRWPPDRVAFVSAVCVYGFLLPGVLFLMENSVSRIVFDGTIFTLAHAELLHTMIFAEEVFFEVSFPYEFGASSVP